MKCLVKARMCWLIRLDVICYGVVMGECEACNIGDIVIVTWRIGELT